MATIITIKNTRDQVIADISAKEILKDVISIALIGRGAENFIEDLNQNFIKILENSASATAPETPMQGQLWFDTANKNLQLWNGESWGINVSKIGGKTLTEVKDWILQYIDLSDKFDKNGGVIKGDLVLEDDMSTNGNIAPTENEIISLGTETKRFKTLYLKDSSLYIGDKGKYHITKDSFIYTIDSNEADVSQIPTGVIIMNAKTGVAVIKKSSGKFDDSNSTFGNLIYDINNAIRLGSKVSNFLGDRFIHSRGWHNGARRNYEYVNLSTPMSTKYFGTPRSMTIAPIGVSGGTRGLWHTGGWPGYNWSSSLEYITFSTPSNGNYFGNATYRAVEGQGASDGVRGLFSGGWNGWWNARNDIEYVTIATPSNSKTFGTTWRRRKYSNTHISDGTKSVNGGGMLNWSWWNKYNDTEYVTIATPSNSTSFGRLRWRRWCNTGVSDATNGFLFGGWWNPRGSVEKFTIATPSNSDYFGNIGNWFAHAAAGSNGNKIAVAGGWGTGGWSWKKIITLDTTTPSNAIHFGNIAHHLHHFDATTGN